MGKSTTTEKKKWKRVPSDLNLWQPKAKNDSIEGLVTQVLPEGKFGLQVKIVDGNGEIFTLPAHKVLQGRLGSVPGLRANALILKVTYTGTEKSKNWPTPMEMYDVDYRDPDPGEFGI